jgi:hypothetical protein
MMISPAAYPLVFMDVLLPRFHHSPGIRIILSEVLQMVVDHHAG